MRNICGRMKYVGNERACHFFSNQTAAPSLDRSFFTGFCVIMVLSTNKVCVQNLKFVKISRNYLRDSCAPDFECYQSLSR